MVKEHCTIDASWFRLQPEEQKAKRSGFRMNNLKILLEKMNDNDKVKAFEFLLSEYLIAGFGVLNKSELDLLFFKIINDSLLNDEQEKGDYALSHLLGITEQRIRNLKIKSALKYPHQEITSDSIKSFIKKQIDNVDIDLGKKLITIPVNDPNIFLELAYYIEKQNGLVYKELNPKIFTVRLDHFIKLLLALNENESDDDVTASKFNEDLIQIIKNEENLKNLVAGLQTNAISAGDFFMQISFNAGLDILSKVPIFGEGLKTIINGINKKVKSKIDTEKVLTNYSNRK